MVSREAATLSKFDYGHGQAVTNGVPERNNLNVYGQDKPPVYDLHQISTPLALFTGATGWQGQGYRVDRNGRDQKHPFNIFFL